MSFDVDTWLTEIRQHIQRGYQDGSMVNILCSNPYEVETPVTSLLKMKNPTPAKISMGWESFDNSSSITTKTVEPARLLHTANLQNVWYMRDEVDLSHYWYRVGHNIAMQEYQHIINSMAACAVKICSFDSEQFEVDQIEKGVNSVSGPGIFPYDLVVNRKDIKKMRTIGDLIPLRQLPENSVPEQLRSNHFLGMIKWLRAYDAPFLQRSAVIFDKQDIQVVTADLSLTFEKRRHSVRARSGGPFVDVSKYCTSEPLMDEAVSIINLKGKEVENSI